MLQRLCRFLKQKDDQDRTGAELVAISLLHLLGVVAFLLLTASTVESF
ncbi:MAG: hypothetical protein JWM56_1324 [Candidatus Peribacteria bacterium]|nr:hypothetical protein [Candidatus Peribacteria bacterium]